MRAIVIDPGHGGLDPRGEYVTPGKRYTFVSPLNGKRTPIYEGARMRVLASLLVEALHDQGVPVYSSLDGRALPPNLSGAPYVFPCRDVGLSSRVAFANSVRGPDGLRPLFLSLHSNAISRESEGVGQSRARGISVWTSTGQTESDRAASCLFAALEAAPLLPMRADRRRDLDPDFEENFYVLRTTKGPAVLIELGFHDHPGDAAWLLQDSNLSRAAGYLAEGVAAWGRSA